MAATKFLTHQEVFKIAKKMTADKPTGIGSFKADYVSARITPNGPVPTIMIYELAGYGGIINKPIYILCRMFQNNTGRGYTEVPVTNEYP